MMEAEMILVAGATGELGRRVVARLRAQGIPVRCLVRPQTDASSLEATGAEVARGDLRDPASLSAACRGVDTVVCTATAIDRLLGGSSDGSLAEVDDAGVGNLIAVAQENGAQRFVYLSYAGVDAGLGFPLERAKAANERRLRESSLRAVIVRPDAFQEVHLGPPGQFDPVNGTVGILGRGDTRRRYVAVDDVAALVAALAVEADPPAIVEVGGPEAISRNEAIAVAEREGGRTLKRRRLPRAALRVAMPALARRKPALASVFGLGLLMDSEESRCEDAPLRARGIEPTPASEHVRRLVSK
jgi:uncharacterized protein YbjT (DUF2867 family)